MQARALAIRGKHPAGVSARAIGSLLQRVQARALQEVARFRAAWQAGVRAFLLVWRKYYEEPLVSTSNRGLAHALLSEPQVVEPFVIKAWVDGDDEPYTQVYTEVKPAKVMWAKLGGKKEVVRSEFWTAGVLRGVR